jgi:hypothetical protein
MGPLSTVAEILDADVLLVPVLVQEIFKEKQ